MAACTRLPANPTRAPPLCPPRSRELYGEAAHACGGVYWNATGGSPCDRALDRVWRASECAARDAALVGPTRSLGQSMPLAGCALRPTAPASASPAAVAGLNL